MHLPRGLLGPELLAQTRACFDWSITHPSPMAICGDEGETIYRIDNHHPDFQDRHRDTLLALPFASMLREVWESEHLWYYAEEIFWKKGNAPRTVWHQDTSYQHWSGENIVNCWISFDPVPKNYSLEVIRSSHRGTRYDGSAFDPDDPTVPLWGDTLNPWGDIPDLARLPTSKRIDRSIRTRGTWSLSTWSPETWFSFTLPAYMEAHQSMMFLTSGAPWCSVSLGMT